MFGYFVWYIVVVGEFVGCVGVVEYVVVFVDYLGELVVEYLGV